MSAKRYAIIGTGAIGGYYGARLQHSGCDVHFLLHSDYEQVQSQGLVVESIDGDMTLPWVNAYNTPTHMPSVDVVVIALKTTQNHHLAELLPPLNDGAVILTLQNGLGIEADIAQVVPSTPIMGGLCFICSNKVGPGHIRHLDYGKIQLGAHSTTHQPQALTATMLDIANDFQQANIPIDITEDLSMARWRKLVWNVPYNGLSVVLDATTNELMADQGMRSQIQTLMTEVITVANTWATHTTKPETRNPENQTRHIPIAFATTMLEVTAKMKPYRTSMKLDFDQHRPLEIEAILGHPIRTATQLGVAIPHMEMLYHQVKFLATRHQT